MNAGRIEQIGTPDEVYAQPASAFVYGFLGSANRFEGYARAPSSTHPDCAIRCLKPQTNSTRRRWPLPVRTTSMFIAMSRAPMGCRLNCCASTAGVRTCCSSYNARARWTRLKLSCRASGPITSNFGR